MHERHAYRLIRDLFAHKEAIFGELKRASALSHTPSGGKAAKESRLRGISTDESHRRENMEARNKAIASRSRNSSPAPHANGHRRDRSTDGRERTRFPISTSPTNERKPVRSSLEVPGSAALDGSNQAQQQQQQQIPSTSNGTPPTVPEHPYPDPTATPQEQQTQTPHPEEMQNGTSSLPDTKDNFPRSSRFPMRKHGTAASLSRSTAAAATDRNSLASSDGEKIGVQLSDRPMDD